MRFRKIVLKSEAFHIKFTVKFKYSGFAKIYYR
jgi:hypothetical protein